MSTPLTKELILSKTKAESLESIKNLNLWGSEINDVRIIRELPNVEVLSLSVNKISSLRDFRYCPKLSELYLRKNNIANLGELKYLQKLQNLKVLWLWDNPCTETSNYRQKVLRYLPNLVKLDNQVITAEEKILNQPSPQKKEIPKSAQNDGMRLHRNNLKEGNNFKEENNVLSAILSLIKELDSKTLELVKMNLDKKKR